MLNKLPLAEDDPFYVKPDDADLFMVSHIVGKACPFCGSVWVFPKAQYNKDTCIWGYYINCLNDKCHGSVFSQGEDRETAREYALERWNKRYAPEPMLAIRALDEICALEDHPDTRVMDIAMCFRQLNKAIAIAGNARRSILYKRQDAEKEQE